MVFVKPKLGKDQKQIFDWEDRRICMKKMSTLLLALLLSLVIPLSASGICKAAEEPVDYGVLFREALDSDGYLVEIRSSDIQSAFWQDPASFWDALSKEESKIIDEVVKLLFYGVREDEWSNITDTTKDLKDSSQYEAIFSAIDKSMSLLSGSGKNEVLETEGELNEFPFEPTIIKGFIDANFQNRNPYNDEFKQAIATAYSVGPELFASLMEEYDESQVLYIAHNVAQGLAQLNLKLPAATEEVSEQTLSFMNKVETAYRNPDAEFVESYFLSPHKKHDAAQTEPTSAVAENSAEAEAGQGNSAWYLAGAILIVSAGMFAGWHVHKRSRKNSSQ